MTRWNSDQRPPSGDPAATAAKIQSRLRLVAAELDERAAATPPSRLESAARAHLAITVPTATELLAAVEHMSWRIEDLARELNCLGHFDDDDPDRPRAA